MPAAAMRAFVSADIAQGNTTENGSARKDNHANILFEKHAPYDDKTRPDTRSKRPAFVVRVKNTRFNHRRQGAVRKLSWGHLKHGYL